MKTILVMADKAEESERVKSLLTRALKEACFFPVKDARTAKKYLHRIVVDYLIVCYHSNKQLAPDLFNAAYTNNRFVEFLVITEHCKTAHHESVIPFFSVQSGFFNLIPN